MSEEEEYYVPGIEEFHVGFEYEYKQLDKERYLNKGMIWSDQVISFNSIRPHKLQIEIEKGTIRVKKLDRKDIEELLLPMGFVVKDGFSSSTELKLIKGSIWSEAITVSLSTDGTLNIKKFKFTGNENSRDNYWNVFAGTIRNKSELSVILKQIGMV